MRDAHTQVVLRDDLYGKMVLQHIDERIVLDGLHQSSLYLGAGIVGVMQDAKFRVSALTVQVESAVLGLVEVHAPVHQFHDLLRCISHHLLHGCGIAYPVAGYHRVVDMFVKIIHQQVGHRGYTALCFGGVGFIQCRLAAQCYLIFLRARDLQCKTHAGHAAADN